jgi:ABC-type nitrate/sulfonate/bicarbonate transport system substrate-binding protein
LRAPVAAVLSSLILVAAGAGCRTASSADTQSRHLRAAYTSAVDIGDVPSLIAHRFLSDAGYQVETTFYAQAELAVEALASGRADVASGGVRAFWAAIAKGAPIKMVMEHAQVGYELVVVPAIKTCDDLHGRTLALSSQGAQPTALGQAFLRRCAHVKPRVIVVPHSGDRLSAIANGAVDATVLQRSDVARLHARAPGRFTTIREFRAMFPDLDFSGVFVGRTLIDARRDVVAAYVRARIQANRLALDTPAALLEEARQWPSMASLDAAIVDGEVRAPAWTADGGITPASLAATLRFFVETGGLPASLSADQIADFSFVGPAVEQLDGEGRTP